MLDTGNTREYILDTGNTWEYMLDTGNKWEYILDTDNTWDYILDTVQYSTGTFRTQSMLHMENPSGSKKRDEKT